MASLNPINPFNSGYTSQLKGPLTPQQNASLNNLNKEEKKLWEVSKSFESLLVNEMFKSMRSTLEGDKLIGENTGTKIFKDFLNTERSEIVANNSDFGIARAIYNANKKFL